MKRLLLAAASGALILAPVTALAAYQTPGELIWAIQENSARTFKVTANGTADQTYVSVWMDGASQGSTAETMKSQTNATVDIVRGSDKLRVKGEMRAVNGWFYAHVDSMEGALAEIFGDLLTGDWVKLPFTKEMSTEMTNGIALDLGSFDAAVANQMFKMTRAEGGGIQVYTLTLGNDASPALAQRIRDMLGDTLPVSDDFFPWQALEDGTRMTLTIKMNDDKFVSSTLALTMKVKHSSFTANVTETAMNEEVKVEIPENVMSFDDVSEALSSWIGARVGTDSIPSWLTDEPKPIYEPSSRFSPYGTNFDYVDYQNKTPDATIWAGELSCRDAEGPALISLQRMGACEAKKVSTRESWLRWLRGQ